MGIGPTRLDDKYFLQKIKLGQGSFGVVWKGVEKTTQRVVAVKQMDKAQLPRRGVKREDVEREVMVMKKVKHQNILELMDFCEDSQYISFVLEYCDGGDFGDKIKERGGSVSESETCGWMMQILSAIRALHNEDVCHRDIKPDNFMVSKTQVIKLADFGLACIVPKGQLLTEKCGTPAFMAPEQMNVGKNRGYSHSVDVWAAGITMFMLMSSGKHPFVDPAGKLDEKKLADGRLDFESSGIFAMFGNTGGFSEQARSFCRRMVNPSSSSRITADKALQDPWIKSAAIGRGGDVTRRPSERAVVKPQEPAPMPDSAPKAGSGGEQIGTGVLGWAGMGGLFGFGMDDQNKPPNVQDGEQVKAAHKQQQLQDMRHGIRKENSELKNQVKELEQRLEQERKEREAIGRRGSGSAGYAAASQGITVRESDRRSSRRPTNISGGVYASAAALNLAGRLPPNMKVRYMSASAGCSLNTFVTGFNESDGTYNLDVRPHADILNITPDPAVRASEAWPPGTLVQYNSSSAGRWLDAVVASFREGEGGLAGTYNLDLRECAEVDRIRPRV